VILTASLNTGYMSVAVSGSTTISASDTRALVRTSGSAIQASAMYVVTGLIAGSNTFTLQYKSNGGTATFSNRNIIVMPL